MVSDGVLVFEMLWVHDSRKIPRVKLVSYTELGQPRKAEKAD
ncbi:uncharacterized protein METZ01_LOCUS512736 [marine metagenome]|uniref:Uncharacterized protein n=1 Tax=marine metagenome TaxID=408172 RepID=A0A383ESD4_9ZZZZ